MKAFYVWRQELGGYFRSPLGYILLGVFLLLAGYFFYGDLVFFVLFGGESLTMGLWRYVFLDMRLVLLLVLPLITMRSFAEERKLGTIELLWTYPVRDVEIIAGKFLAAVSFLLLMLAPTVLYGGLLALVHPFDAGSLLVAYAGVVLLGTAFIACGMAASSLTESQVVSAMLAYGVLMLSWFLTWNEGIASEGFARVLLALSLFDHFYNFARGVIDTRDVAYFLLFTAFFLFLALRALQSRSWRGVW
jgi:ABC-2 type transport system permease protein